MPLFYYGRLHDYVFYPSAWTDESTGTSYESGYYDENGQYYPNVSFAKNGQYENVVCHCAFCDQDTILNPTAEDVSARNLHCPNCGAPMEIRSELDEYRSASDYSSAFSAQSRRKSRKWIIPLVILLILAGLVGYGRKLLRDEAARNGTAAGTQTGTQTESFRITEDDYVSDVDLFGSTLHLSASSDQGYTVSRSSADKDLVWDQDAESYYDKSTDCWVWYNTEVDPAVWQYWYEGISSDFGDYGWMEHDEDGWFIERSYGNWIELPDTYDAGRLWFIEE